MSSVYCPDTVVDVKNSPRSGRPIIKTIDKIIEIVESDGLVSTVSIFQLSYTLHKKPLGTIQMRLDTKRSSMSGFYTR